MHSSVGWRVAGAACVPASAAACQEAQSTRTGAGLIAFMGSLVGSDNPAHNHGVWDGARSLSEERMQLRPSTSFSLTLSSPAMSGTVL